jgi:hypothetical protein
MKINRIRNRERKKNRVAQAGLLYFSLGKPMSNMQNY